MSCGDLDRYLAALFADAPPATFAEIRYRAGDYMSRVFHDAANLGAAARTIENLGHRQTDVYIGVLPRLRRGGTRNDVVRCARILWADCDTPAATAALDSFRPTPSIQIATSAGKSHAYWLLRDALSLDALETSNRRIAAALHADQQCTDAARVMRALSVTHRSHQPDLNWLVVRRHVGKRTGACHFDLVTGTRL